MHPVKGKDSSNIGQGREEGRNTDIETEDQDLKEFFRVLGLTATVDILKSIQKGKNQYLDFFTTASVSTVNERIKQLITLGIIKHHLGREPRRKEWYTLTERGERVLKATVRLEKAFQGK